MSVAIATLNCVALLAFSFGASMQCCSRRMGADAATLPNLLLPRLDRAPHLLTFRKGTIELRARARMPQEHLLLGAGDLLDVRVFDTPELSGKFRVDNLGQITLPVGGTIKVLGLTPNRCKCPSKTGFASRTFCITRMLRCSCSNMPLKA